MSYQAPSSADGILVPVHDTCSIVKIDRPIGRSNFIYINFWTSSQNQSRCRTSVGTRPLGMSLATDGELMLIEVSILKDLKIVYELSFD